MSYSFACSPMIGLFAEIGRINILFFFYMKQKNGGFNNQCDYIWQLRGLDP